MRVIRVGNQTPELVERFQGITAEISKYVVGRTGQLQALKICLLTKKHLLLLGKPGLAKSRFALLAFKLFKDAQIYRNLFHGQMTTDEVIGPPNPKIMRERGVFEYNCEGLLPTAHFAYLDELFNGPSAVLNSALNILNEGVFMSGGKARPCPLLTATATSNRVSDEQDLLPLLDRFLITQQVKAADSEDARSKILEAFIAPRLSKR